MFKKAGKATKRSTPQVIIVGGGIAGLACARELLKSGAVHPIVFEARPRIGGRVYTSRLDIDLGCSWLHGIDGNPLSEFIKEAIPTAKLLKTEPENAILRDANGEMLPRELVMETYLKFMGLMEQVKSYAHEKLNGPKEGKEQDEDQGGNPNDRPLLEVIEEVYRNTPDVQAKNDKEKMVLNFFLSQLESYNAAPLSQLSARHHDSSAEMEGGDHLLEGGFGQVITALAKGVDVRVGHAVKHIEVQPVVALTDDTQASVKAAARHGKVVCVTTADGRKHFANAVVVTVPLGVLQNKSIEFRPPLPGWKTAAIQRLGSGVHNRVILEFPTVFWEAGIEWIGFNHVLPGEQSSVPASSSSLAQPRFNCWFENYYPHTQRPILVCLVSGEWADRIRSMNDEQVVAALMRRLKLMYKNAVEPTASVIMRWEEAPVALGAYTYVKVGATPHDVARLGRTVHELVFFGGESTAEQRFSYADGAYASGVREAERVAHLFAETTSSTRAQNSAQELLLSKL